MHSTGVIGCTAILHALVERAERGGSYGVDVRTDFPRLPPATEVFL